VTAAELAAALEVERAQPTPRLPKKPTFPPVTNADAARHRAELLAALSNAA